MTARHYDATARRLKAAALREKILETSKRLFTVYGFAATTIAQIASKAGCSEAKIYAAFASKGGILAALVEQVAFGDDYHEAVAQGALQADPVLRLRWAARIARIIYEAERDSFTLMRGAGMVSEELAAWERGLEGRRFERQAPLICSLEADGALRDGMTVERARQLLWALTSRELFRDLVVEQGWEAGAYETWLADLLVAQLLG